jgi:iron complex outermembrane receptor protein
VGTFRNDSEIAKALGIPSLGAESSTNLSLGVTSKIANSVSVTVDAYQIDIKNRVVLTGNIARTAGGLVDNLLTQGNVPPDVTSVAFFTNAIDTRTRGIDIVLATSQKIGKGSLDITAGANFNESEIIGAPKTTDKLPQDQFGKTFFSRIEESRIVVGQPRSKVSMSLNYRVNKLNVNLRGTNFGQVEIWDAANVQLDEVQTPKTVIDLSLGYKISKKITFNVGANNLMDVYPDKIKNYGNSSNGRFIYSRNVTQFGFGGRYVYSAVRIDL